MIDNSADHAVDAEVGEKLLADGLEPGEALTHGRDGGLSVAFGGEEQPVLDRPRRALRSVGQQLDVRVAERSVGPAADNCDAEDSSVHDQGDADERPNPLFGPACAESLER